MIGRLTLLAPLAMAGLLAAPSRAQTAATCFASFNQAARTPTTSDDRPGSRTITVSDPARVDFRVGTPSFLKPGEPRPDDQDAVLAMQGRSAVDGSWGLLSGLFEGGPPPRGFPSPEGGVPTTGLDVAAPIVADEPGPGVFREVFDRGLSPGLAGPPGEPMAPGGGSQGSDAGVSGASAAGFGVIPEPTTLAMAGLGVLALSIALRVARRRRLTAAG